VSVWARAATCCSGKARSPDIHVCQGSHAGERIAGE
jgi:hypothetical protein